MRTVAFLSALAFGCATVRTPLPGTPLPPVGRVALAEPQLELRMEGTRPVDSRESARALDASRAALEDAVAGRGLDGVTDPQQLLVIREWAIKRTGERKTAQVLSAVGIVFVVAAVVVTAILLSRSGSSGKPHAVVPSRPGGARAPVRPAYPVRRALPPPPVFGVSMGLAVAVPGGPLPPPPGEEPFDARLAGRSWFDGDEVELSVELADPATGTVSWRRILRGGIDPANPKAISAMLDRALAGLPFGRRRGEPAPASAPENP